MNVRVILKNGKYADIVSLQRVYRSSGQVCEDIPIKSFYIDSGATMNFVGAKSTVALKGEEISLVTFES